MKQYHEACFALNADPGNSAFTAAIISSVVAEGLAVKISKTACLMVRFAAATDPGFAAAL